MIQKIKTVKRVTGTTSGRKLVLVNGGSQNGNTGFVVSAGIWDNNLPQGLNDLTCVGSDIEVNFYQKGDTFVNKDAEEVTVTDSNVLVKSISITPSLNAMIASLHAPKVVEYDSVKPAVAKETEKETELATSPGLEA